MNTSPEPASNLVISTAEDATVAGVVTLGVLYPWAAAVVAGVLLVIGALLVTVLLRVIRSFRARRRARTVARDPDAGHDV